MDQLIIFCAKYLFVGVVLIWIVAWIQSSKKKLNLAAATTLAGIIALALGKIASQLYYDPRPFVTNNITPLVAHAADNGFPSEHSLFTVTLASVLIFYRPRFGIAALTLAVLVGIGRVAANVHSPVDIMGGLLIGLISAYLGYLAASKLIKRYNLSS